MANSARGVVAGRPGAAGTAERLGCGPAGRHAADRAEPEILIQRQLDLWAMWSQYGDLCRGRKARLCQVRLPRPQAKRHVRLQADDPPRPVRKATPRRY